MNLTFKKAFESVDENDLISYIRCLPDGFDIFNNIRSEYPNIGKHITSMNEMELIINAVSSRSDGWSDRHMDIMLPLAGRSTVERDFFLRNRMVLKSEKAMSWLLSPSKLSIFNNENPVMFGGMTDDPGVLHYISNETLNILKPSILSLSLVDKRTLIDKLIHFKFDNIEDIIIDCFKSYLIEFNKTENGQYKNYFSEKIDSLIDALPLEAANKFFTAISESRNDDVVNLMSEKNKYFLKLIESKSCTDFNFSNAGNIVNYEILKMLVFRGRFDVISSLSEIESFGGMANDTIENNKIIINGFLKCYLNKKTCKNICSLIDFAKKTQFNGVLPIDDMFVNSRIFQDEDLKNIRHDFASFIIFSAFDDDEKNILRETMYNPNSKIVEKLKDYQPDFLIKKFTINNKEVSLLDLIEKRLGDTPRADLIKAEWSKAAIYSVISPNIITPKSRSF